VLCLLAIFAIPFIPRLIDGPGLPVLMFSFMAPAAFGLLILVWWIVGSRASAKEKAWGVLGVAVVAAIGYLLLDPTINGFGIIIHVLPAVAAAFGLALVLLAAVPRWRLPIALIAAAVTFGYWDLLRFDGVTGQFQSQLAWRWQPTPEETYIQGLATAGSATAGSAAGQSAPATASPVNLAEAEWPAFRGPLRNGQQPGVALPEQWSASVPRRMWRVPIGPGWSSFSAASSRLYTQEQRGDREAIVCLDAETGATIWAREYDGRFFEAVSGAGPRATPTLDAAGVFALGANGDLLRLDPSDGRPVWQADLKVDAHRSPPIWGFACSPLVVDGKVIVHAGGSDGLGVLAYDVESGKIVWTAASGDHSYSSPQLATFHGVTGVLMATNTGLQFLDPADGTELWSYPWPIENYRAIQPLVKENTVLLSATLGKGTRSLQIAKDPEWSVTENWSSRDLKPDFNDYVEHKGFLYGFDANILSCVDLTTGKRKWKKGRYGNGQVVLLPDADQLLVCSETGELVLVRASSEKFEELAKIPAIEGKTWNHPIVLGSRVYVRNSQEAACYDFGSESLAKGLAGR
jgi:outer membrane protein assembly factor BamB